MAKILLIGDEFGSLPSGLSARGYNVSILEPANMEKAIHGSHKDNPVILLGQSGKKAFDIEKIFIESKGIPKVIIQRAGLEKSAKWLKEPLTYISTPDEENVLELLARIETDRRLEQENRLLRAQYINMEKELRFFEDLSSAVISSEEDKDVLLLLIKRIKERTEAETCSIYLLNQDSGDLLMERTEGSLRKQTKLPAKAGDGLAGFVQREGKPILITNVYKDTELAQKLDREIRHKSRTLIYMPIRSKGKILGVLELINKTDNSEFDQQDFTNISRFIDHVALVIERAILYEKMQELVITDDLTKLFNTRYMTRTIEGEVARSVRYKTSVSLIFMDIDYFKNVNDNHGHLIGSKILVEMAQLLIKHLRDVDIVARYGGDEFVIILPQTPPNMGIKTAERIRGVVENHVFLKKEGINLKLTASFGVASFPENARSKEDLIRLADEAMYKVKHRTRNGVYAIMQDGSV